MTNITFNENTKILKGNILLPGSKSISNRALIINAFKIIKIENVSNSSDTVLLSNILSENKKYVNVENAGTLMRFLTAYFSVTKGEWEITGIDRIKQRPVKELVEALKEMGANISYLKKDGFLPLKIIGKQLDGGHIKVNSGVSSQFISALMLIAPQLKNGLSIELLGNTVSLKYIEMTASILEYFGVNIVFQNNKIKINNQNILSRSLSIESDWSSAAYFYGFVALSNSAQIKLKNFQENSWQGDSIISKLMYPLGVKTDFDKNSIILTKKEIDKTSVEFELTSNPDLIPTIAVVCSCLKIPFKIKGTKSLRIKESDRVAVLASELKKIGVELSVSKNEIFCKSFKDIEQKPIKIKTFNDHRIAMSFAIVAYKYKNLIIDDIDVVKKSYPEFWNDLKKIGINKN